MSRALRLLPIILLVWILGTFAWRLVQPDDPAVRSQLVNREVPAFALPPALPGVPGLRSAELATGKPRLLNLFASWCVPCIGEAPVLEELKSKGVEIDGIAIRDTQGGVAAFLDPSRQSLSAASATIRTATCSCCSGSAGVPETFIVDGKGVIRHQFIGPIGPRDVPKVLAELEKVR